MSSSYDGLDHAIDEAAGNALDSWRSHHVAGIALEDEATLKAPENTKEYWHRHISAAFADFRNLPDPTGFDWELAEVVASANQINVTPGVAGPGGTGKTGATAGLDLAGTLQDLNTRAGQLDGATAESFYDTYVTKLPTLIGNLHVATTGQAVALAWEQKLWERARHDVGAIAGKLSEAMYESHAQGGGGVGLGEVLTIVGAAALAVAAVATGGGALVVGATLGGIGASAAAGLVGGDDQPPAAAHVGLGADTPEGVLDNLNDALTRLAGEIFDEERKIERFTVSLRNAVLDRDDNFDIASPTLLRDDRGGHVLSAKQMVLSRSQIHHITDGLLPDVGHTLGHSAATRDEPSSGHWSRGGDLGIGATGPFYAYQELNDAITARESNTRSEVLASAEHLRIAAATIGRVDEHTNARLTVQTRNLGLIPLQRDPDDAADRFPDLAARLAG